MFSLKSFYRFNLRLLILVITGLIVSSSAYSQFQLETNYPGIEPNPPETPQTLITVDDETQSPHTLFGGFILRATG